MLLITAVVGCVSFAAMSATTVFSFLALSGGQRVQITKADGSATLLTNPVVVEFGCVGKLGHAFWEAFLGSSTTSPSLHLAPTSADMCKEWDAEKVRKVVDVEPAQKCRTACSVGIGILFVSPAAEGV